MFRETPYIPESEIGLMSRKDTEAERKRAGRRSRPDSAAGLIERYFGGDAHTHTEASTSMGHYESSLSLQEQIAYSKAVGRQFLVNAEHPTNPAKPHQLEADSDVERGLLAHAEKIRDLNIYKRERGEGKECVVLSGVEVSIFFDLTSGEPIVDLPREVLRKLDLDIVIASRHTIEREKELPAIEETLTMAIQHPDIDVIGHPDRNINIRHNWDTFRKNYPPADAFHRQMVALQEREKALRAGEEKASLRQELEAMYALIRKIIGKARQGDEQYPDAREEKWSAEFHTVERRYWEMWDRLLTKMAAEGKAFEINLNSNPQAALLERVAYNPDIPVFLTFDIHDVQQFHPTHDKEYHKKATRVHDAWAGDRATAEDLQSLRALKLQGLTSGPGVRRLLQLARMIKKLEAFGLTPDRVVNSSKANLLNFLRNVRGKRTENLELLAR